MLQKPCFGTTSYCGKANADSVQVAMKQGDAGGGRDRGGGGAGCGGGGGY